LDSISQLDLDPVNFGRIQDIGYTGRQEYWISGVEHGGEGLIVGKLQGVVCFKLEAYSEPKALSKADLRNLMRDFRSTVKVAKHIGASQAFVCFQLST